MILDYKQLKLTKYVGQEKLFYQHMVETLLETRTFGLSIDRVDADSFQLFEVLCRDLTQRKDLIHYSSFKLVKEGLDGVLEMRERGIKVVAVTNASIPMRHKLVIEEHAKVELSQLFDLFVTAQDLGGLRMPDPQFIHHVISRFPDIE